MRLKFQCRTNMLPGLPYTSGLEINFTRGIFKMKRIAAICLAVVLAAFSFNFAPVAHAGTQSTKSVADIQSSSSPVEAEPQDPQSQTQGTGGGQENPFRRD